MSRKKSFKYDWTKFMDHEGHPATVRCLKVKTKKDYVLAVYAGDPYSSGEQNLFEYVDPLTQQSVQTTLTKYVQACKGKNYAPGIAVEIKIVRDNKHQWIKLDSKKLGIKREKTIREKNTHRVWPRNPQMTNVAEPRPAAAGPQVVVAPAVVAPAPAAVAPAVVAPAAVAPSAVAPSAVAPVPSPDLRRPVY